MKPKKKAKELINKFLNMPICESVESAKYASNFTVEEIKKTGVDNVYWEKVQDEIYNF